MRSFTPEQEKERKDFIRRCIENDARRFEGETYIDTVTEITGTAYTDDGLPEHTFDMYEPAGGAAREDEAFILIHGGAFVYGTNILDKRYGYYLADKSGLKVANVNYRLLPDTDITGSIRDIVTCITFLHDNYGIKKIYVTGDSAGGYLALATTLCYADSRFRESIGIKVCEDIEAGPAGLVCGVYRMEKNIFPGVYLAPSDEEGALPDHMYDLGEAVKAADPASLQFVLVTGEDDYLREDSFYMKKICDEAGIKAKLFNYDSTPERAMQHVFPIAHAFWPESQEVIEYIARSAVNGRVGV